MSLKDFLTPISLCILPLEPPSINHDDNQRQNSTADRRVDTRTICRRVLATEHERAGDAANTTCADKSG